MVFMWLSWSGAEIVKRSYVCPWNILSLLASREEDSSRGVYHKSQERYLIRDCGHWAVIKLLDIVEIIVTLAAKNLIGESKILFKLCCHCPRLKVHPPRNCNGFINFKGDTDTETHAPTAAHEKELICNYDEFRGSDKCNYFYVAIISMDNLITIHLSLFWNTHP